MQLSEKNLKYMYRPHSYGISYFCNERKAFIFVNLRKHFVSIKFYTGNGFIACLEKSNWLNGGDNHGSETFRILDEDSLTKAIEYALKAYKITADEQQSAKTAFLAS